MLALYSLALLRGTDDISDGVFRANVFILVLDRSVVEIFRLVRLGDLCFKNRRSVPLCITDEFVKTNFDSSFLAFKRVDGEVS